MSVIKKIILPNNDQYDIACDYSNISNKPSVNGVSLSGNQTGTTLGVIDAPSSPATGAFLVWNGSSWVAQTLSVWAGGDY